MWLLHFGHQDDKPVVPRAFLLVLPVSPHAGTSPHVAGGPAVQTPGFLRACPFPSAA